jgi:hypothetical protein
MNIRRWFDKSGTYSFWSESDPRWRIGGSVKNLKREDAPCLEADLAKGTLIAKIGDPPADLEYSSSFTR